MRSEGHCWCLIDNMFPVWALNILFLKYTLGFPISNITRSFLARNDIGIILINQFIAEMIRHAIDGHMESIPAIPSKEHPYDASKDSILRRAKGMFCAEDFR
ncbi:V-type proton ATPase subunit F [Triplophysa tibetana]|uniref:V-ATPase 14 kDa subunit n=1 Tax=Triplophysa tibetana TaxID=1572043 RepID=A0A5A9PH48_9TELE|nr:V-type proton ATPase subunit F [Triplophysa tibetana]